MPVSTFHSTLAAQIMDDTVWRTVRLVTYLVLCTALEYPTHEDIHFTYETFKTAPFNAILYEDICRLTHLYIAKYAMAFNIAALTVKITPLIYDTLKRIVEQRGLKWRPGSSYFLRKNKKRLQMEVFDMDDEDLGVFAIAPEPLLCQRERLRGTPIPSCASMGRFNTGSGSDGSLACTSSGFSSPNLPFSHLHWEQVKLFVEDSTSAIPHLGILFLKVIISIVALNLGVFLKKGPEEIGAAMSYACESYLAASLGPSFAKKFAHQGRDYDSNKRAERLMGVAYGFLLLNDTREADRWLTDHSAEVIVSAFMRDMPCHQERAESRTSTSKKSKLIQGSDI